MNIAKIIQLYLAAQGAATRIGETAVAAQEGTELFPAWHSANCCGKDEIVRHKGKIWASDTENNTWEPGVYGWEEVS